MTLFLLPIFRGLRLLALLLIVFGGAGKDAHAGSALCASRVAVFFEPGFPFYGVPLEISPPRLVKRLREAGIAAELVGEAALADPSRFNARTFSVLVLPCGNTYPERAFASLKAFHQGGGGFVLSGVAFTHPVSRNAQGTWVDRGHSNEAARFGENGLGVGGFTDSGKDLRPFLTGDPLQLGFLPLNWSLLGHTQRLDPRTLPPGDAVRPILGAAENPVLALIVHRAAPYAGAVDFWLARAPEGDLEGWGTEQLLLRGAVGSLRHKNLLTETQAKAAFARFARLPKPPVYANLVLPAAPRPAPALRTKPLPPARHLEAIEVRGCTFEERVLLLSLQGLVNRTLPRLYLIFNDSDRFWLQEMQRQGDTDAPVTAADPMSVIEHYRSEVRGAVLSDPKVSLSPCIAACLAGADRLLMATPELAQKFHLPVRADLRGKFRDNPAALRFLRTRLLPRLNPLLLCCLDPALFDSGALDQIIAARGIVFWITGTKAQHLPGANQPGEIAEIKALLSKLPLGGVVRGFWWHGDDIGLNEGAGVSLASRFGKMTVVSDYVANFSVFSGVSKPTLRQKPSPPLPPLDPAKIYYSFTMSDGDNLCTWRDYFRTYFDDPLHGTIPIGWGMGPTLRDYAPVWARWYYEHAAPNDEFLCDVSGAGYIYGPDWGASLKDRDGAFADFYHRTAEAMKRMEMHTLRLMNVEASDIAKAAKLLPEVRFLMPDYGNPGDKSYAQLTYRLPGDQIVFRAVTGADGGAEKLAEQIRQRVGTARPAFLNVFIWNWGSKLSDLKRIQELLGSDYTAVTPSQLNALYRRAHPSEEAKP